MALRPGADISRQQQRGAALTLAVIQEGRPAPGRICRDRTEELAQLPGATGIEGTIGAAAELGNLAEGPAGDLVASFVKDEDRSAAETELAGEAAQLVDLLLHRIAHEDERINLVGAGFLARVGKHTSNLRRAPDTGHAAHGSMKLPRGGEPAARLAFVEAAIEDELDIKPADRPRRLEHFTLQPARAIPRCLAACGRIEREDESASPVRWLRHLHSLDLHQESINLRRFARGGQMVLLLLFLGHSPIYWVLRKRRQALA